jgi:RNA polymerase sigma-70 factor (ECF subfamily)
MAAGDRAAFAQFYDRHAILVHTLATRIVRDRDDAEEVVQDAFLQVWRQADRFDGQRGSPAAWLTTIARTRALDRLRRRGLGAHATTEILENTVATEVDELSQGLAPTVRRLLDDLPSEQRGLIKLAYYEGLSQSQIAEVTGQPLGTVKTRIRLGMIALREALHVEAH